MQESSEVKGAEVTKMRVVARLRPFRTTDQFSKSIVEISDNVVTITDPEGEKKSQFHFDACHWSCDGFVVNDDGVYKPDGPNSRYSDQEAIFRDVGQKLVDAAWQGHNSAVMAYGMTGSGKSYTILGNFPDPGLVHRCCRHLFSEIDRNPQNKYKVTLSLLEIHNDKLIDLLSKRVSSLQIREKPSGTYVKDLTILTVRSAAQTEEVVLQGLRSRAVATTKMNSNSSRSHLVLTLHFLQYIKGSNGTRTKRRAHMRFIDLAGSERSKRTGTSGATLSEGKIINQSLSGLGSVISALADQTAGKKAFIPYRSTKITQLLKTELGGNCATTIIASISPYEHDYAETLTTLRFVGRAKNVTATVKVNDFDVDMAVKTWENTIAEKETQLSAATSEEEKAELEKAIGMHRLCIRQLEAPWLEKDTKEKSVTWWSTSVQLQQGQLETTPYLQNISDDPLLSGVTKHLIPQGHTLAGKSDSDEVGIHLSGLGIQPWHAILVNTGTAVSIAPCSSRSTVHVNGRPIHVATELHHLDHVKLGAGELFIVVGFPDKRTAGKASAVAHSYEKCLTEFAEKHPLAPKIKAPDGSSVRAQTAALLMLQEFTELLSELAQAQAMAVVFDKNVDFDVEARPGEKTTEVFYIRVYDRDIGKEWIWSKRKFEDRKMLMDQLYENFLSTGKAPKLNKKNDPFHDAENLDVYLGRCKVSLHNIAHHMPTDDHVRVYDFRGKQVGCLHIRLTPATSEGELLQGAATGFRDPKELIGKPLHLKCVSLRFSSVLWAAASPQRAVYCKAWLSGGEREAQTTDKVPGAVSGTFNTTFTFTISEVTTTQLDLLQSGRLVLELWGADNPSLATPSAQPSVSEAESQQRPTDTGHSSDGGGVVLDLDLAQDLRQFFRNVCPVQQKLQNIKEQAGENSQKREVGAEAWADCREQLQEVESQLKQCVASLKESVKTAIHHSKQSQ
ncbi:kinesin-like protein KIF28 [Babylonia areolata]|uniref:kinesin-like protein KIF28 n=1 Tax=Babylonia areolata TaxID=304850 RepID=UPI003FD54E99